MIVDKIREFFNEVIGNSMTCLVTREFLVALGVVYLLILSTDSLSSSRKDSDRVWRAHSELYGNIKFPAMRLATNYVKGLVLLGAQIDLLFIFSDILPQVSESVLDWGPNGRQFAHNFIFPFQDSFQS